MLFLSLSNPSIVLVAVILIHPLRRLRRIKQIGPFHYSHQGSLAYIGAEKAVADVTFSWWKGSNLASGGTMTYLFWKSAYLSMCFSTRNRMLVVLDWMKAKFFGRDVSRE